MRVKRRESENKSECQVSEKNDISKSISEECRSNICEQYRRNESE